MIRHLVCDANLIFRFPTGELLLKMDDGWGSVFICSVFLELFYITSESQGRSSIYFAEIKTTQSKNIASVIIKYEGCELSHDWLHRGHFWKDRNSLHPLFVTGRFIYRHIPTLPALIKWRNDKKFNQSHGTKRYYTDKRSHFNSFDEEKRQWLFCFIALREYFVRDLCLQIALLIGQLHLATIDARTSHLMKIIHSNHAARLTSIPQKNARKKFNQIRKNI